MDASFIPDIQNPNFESQPRDILHGANNRNIPGPRPHFIIDVARSEDLHHEFLDAMLTGSKAWGNIPLRKDHFEQVRRSGPPWKVKFDINAGSFIGSDLLRKLVDWSPFAKVGQLTPNGLAFVLQHLDGHLTRYSRLNAS